MFFTDTWRPRSFYPRIAANRAAGLHTLCLLDIKVREPSLESLARGRKARACFALPQFSSQCGSYALWMELRGHGYKVCFRSSIHRAQVLQ